MINWKHVKSYLKKNGIKANKEEILDTLNYNVVLSEICGQIKFLREELLNKLTVEEEIKQVEEKHKGVILKI